MADPLDAAEAAAFGDVCEAAPAAFAREHGVAVARVGSAVCGLVGALPGVRDLNRVVGADAETDVGAVLAFYDGAEHIVAARPEAGGLAARLREHGYAPAYAWMKFARPAGGAPEAATDLRLEIVGADRARDFAGPVAGGFGMPPFMADWLAALPGRAGWTCLAAYDPDRPVAGGALFVEGGEAWVGMGATLPQARGRGAQSAILAERVRLAAKAGCVRITTETGVREAGRPDRSYRNILRAGFQEPGCGRTGSRPERPRARRSPGPRR